MQEAIEIFKRHVTDRGLNQSAKRDLIVEMFLQTRSHVSAQELYEKVRAKDPAIGFTTVYRTLKLIVESGLSDMVDFNDGVRRFEHSLGRDFHAHCICTRCGRDFELFDEQIRGLSEGLARQKAFEVQKLRYEIFGLCRSCRRQEQRKQAGAAKATARNEG